MGLADSWESRRLICIDFEQGFILSSTFFLLFAVTRISKLG